jgi:hypothetical protein
MRVLAILYKGFRGFIAGVFGGGFRFMRKWPEKRNIAPFLRHCGTVRHAFGG